MGPLIVTMTSFTAFLLLVLPFLTTVISLGPYRGHDSGGALSSSHNPSYGGALSSPHNPSCVSFTFQDDLPAETVQLITYGAPEVSITLAMGLTGDQKTFPSPGQEVTVHYALFLDDCTLVDSSRDREEPFVFTMGADDVIEGFERGIAQMSLGQRVSLTLSPDMGYGEAGTSDGAIPPNAALIFDLEIIKTIKSPAYMK